MDAPMARAVSTASVMLLGRLAMLGQLTGDGFEATSASGRFRATRAISAMPVSAENDRLVAPCVAMEATVTPV